MGRRVALAVAVVGMLGLAIFLALRLFSPSQALLFSDLSPRDLAAVASQLDEQGVVYRVDTDRGALFVPDADVHRIRMAVMADGIPLQGGVGFELFDDVEFGMTEFTQRVNFQRALQGELTRTVAALREVERARLHLSLPERSLFEREREAPKAALTLTLREGMRLSTEQADGIRRLVAAAVPGLQESQVSLHDQHGAAIDADGAPAPAQLADRLQAKRDVEVYLQDKAQGVLDRLFGAGEAVVTVDVVLDHDRVQRQRERALAHADGRGVLVRQEGDVGAGNGRAEYVAGREIDRILVAPGTVMRLTVAAVLPAGVADEHRDVVAALLADSVGLDASRGDSVSVHAGIPVRGDEAGDRRDAAGIAVEGAEPGVDLGASLQADLDARVHDWVAALADAARETSEAPWRFDRMLVPAGIGLLLLSVLLLWLLRRDAPLREAPNMMSDEARQAALAQLKAWLVTDMAPPMPQAAKAALAELMAEAVCEGSADDRSAPWPG